MISIPTGRRFTRYEYLDSPVFLEAPGVSPVMLEPENICWAGFDGLECGVNTLGARWRISGALRDPVPGMTMKCNLEIMEELFQGLTATILWSAKATKAGSDWLMGANITIPDAQLDRFRKAMKQSFLHVQRVVGTIDT